MNTQIQGIGSSSTESSNYNIQKCNDGYVVASNWFVNRCPLVTRVPRVPISITSFPVYRRNDREWLNRKPYLTQHCQAWRQQADHGSEDYHKTSGQPFTRVKMDALQNLMEEMETTSYYGKGADPAMNPVPKQKGLRTIIQRSSANFVDTPEGLSAYRPSDLIRDALESPRASGGDPDVLLLSSDFFLGLATWGHPALRVNAGNNLFGVPIDVYEAPFLGGISIIECPMLRAGTAVALTSSEVRMRTRRNEFWSPRGNRDEPNEGEWIAEGAIEIDDPDHHAWIEGVTGFSL